MELVSWNWVAFGVHTAATVASYIILKPSKKAKRVVNMSQLVYDVTKQTDSKVDLPVKIEDGVQIDLKLFIVGFFAITAVSHLLYATDFFGKGWYSKAINGYGWNPYRWAEYSLSAGLMTYLISIVSGTKEEVSAVASALIVPSLMVNGLTTERSLNQNALHMWSLVGGPSADIDAVVVWANIIPSWFLFFTNWYIILSNYARISKGAKEAGRPVDASVKFMVYSQLFFFSMFGVIMTYQVYRWATAHKGRVEPKFLSYEKAYIVLSTVTKLILASTVVYAVN